MRTRRRTKRGEQYEKLDEQAHFYVVKKADLSFASILRTTSTRGSSLIIV